MVLLGILLSPILALISLLGSVISQINLGAIEQTFLEFIIVGKLPFTELYYGFELIAVFLVIGLWSMLVRRLYSWVMGPTIQSRVGGKTVQNLPFNIQISVLKERLVLKWRNRLSPQL